MTGLNDLVAKLRTIARRTGYVGAIDEAADLIESQAAEIERLRGEVAGYVERGRLRWQSVCAIDRPGFTEGFDREAEYEFRRFDDPEIMRFRMAQQSPYFNLAGLLYREPPPHTHDR